MNPFTPYRTRGRTTRALAFALLSLSTYAAVFVAAIYLTIAGAALIGPWGAPLGFLIAAGLITAALYSLDRIRRRLRLP